MKPSIGQVVHYVSYGTPNGEYESECRAAIITYVDQYQPPVDDAFIGHVDLCVLNPTGVIFGRGVHYHDGGETPGKPDCPNDHAAMPFRYCPEPGCGWQEASHKGGTWHWPEP